jgi:hypothetical protein
MLLRIHPSKTGYFGWTQDTTLLSVVRSTTVYPLDHLGAPPMLARTTVEKRSPPHIARFVINAALPRTMRSGPKSLNCIRPMHFMAVM